MIDSAITHDDVLRKLEHASIIAHNGATFLCGMRARIEEKEQVEVDIYDNLIEELETMSERIMECHEELTQMIDDNRKGDLNEAIGK
jgi:hypothetical protein